MLFIKNLTRAGISGNYLRSVAKISLMNLPKLSEKSKNFEIDLVIVGEKRIKELNWTWRKKNKVTDVLSFESGQLKKGRKDFIVPKGDSIHLGQVFICYQVAAKQAKEYGFTVKEELARLLVHGILHLAGYDHEKNIKEEKKMSGLEKIIMEKI